MGDIINIPNFEDVSLFSNYQPPAADYLCEIPDIPQVQHKEGKMSQIAVKLKITAAKDQVNFAKEEGSTFTDFIPFGVNPITSSRVVSNTSPSGCAFLNFSKSSFRVFIPSAVTSSVLGSSSISQSKTSALVIRSLFGGLIGSLGVAENCINGLNKLNPPVRDLNHYKKALISLRQQAALFLVSLDLWLNSNVK